MAGPTTDKLAAELADLLGGVVRGWAIERVELGPPRVERVGFAKLDASRFEAWISSPGDQQMITLGCSSNWAVSEDEVRLMQRLCSVFRSDLNVVGHVLVAQDQWSALAATQFLRAAARLSPFSTNPLLRWIRIFEAATRQTYEGAEFTGNVVLVKHLPSFRNLAGDRLHAFSRPLEFEQALLREKWLKPFLQDGTFALATVGHSGAAHGFVEASRPWQDSQVLAPVEELDGLYGFLRPGTSILSAPPSGDIHFALSTGVTFVNHQGKWGYQDWDGLRRVLANRLEPGITEHALRLVAGASYERRGSLYVFLNDGVDVAEMVPDHASPNRSSDILRSTVAGGFLGDAAILRVLRAASKIDGAVLLDNHGCIADVASMISEPSLSALASAGQNQLERFPGARSTAAWNASINGLAIKISDDGPVDVYEGGRHIFRSG